MFGAVFSTLLSFVVIGWPRRASYFSTFFSLDIDHPGLLMRKAVDSSGFSREIERGDHQTVILFTLS
jgi:hypothetical protein